MTSRPVLRGLWADVPLLNFALYAVAIAHAEIANLDPPRLEYVPTFLFPLGAMIVVYALRWPRATNEARVTSMAIVLGVPAMIALSYFSGLRSPIDHATLRTIYEYSAIANTLLLIVHAWSWQPRLVPFILGPAAVYGLLLENGGILLGYFSEMSYELYLGPLPAPIATMSGWITVFYLVVWVAWEVRAHVGPIARSVTLSAAVAAAAGLALDLQIDPLATAVGFWRWNPLLPGGPFDVPTLNFVAWACAIFPFAWFVFARENEFGLAPTEIALPEHRRWLWPRVPLVLGVATVLFITTMAIFEGGISGPTFAILRGAAVRYGLLEADAIWIPGP